MAADLIEVDRSKQGGNQLVRLAQLISEARSLSELLFAAANHGVAAGDFTQFERVFGLVAGTGANTITVLGNTRDILNTNEEVAGQTRKDRLDEFEARLAVQ
jgi:hypothetical protein